MKKLTPILAAVALTPVLAGAILIATFDANQYKPQLVELGRTLSGREFEIRGELHLKLSLTPTLVAEGLRLGNAAWGSHATMLDIRRLEARVALLPLLRHQVEIKRLRVSGANLVLERDRGGRGNWAFDRAERDTAAAPDTTPRLFELEDVEIGDSRVEFRGAAGNVRVIDITNMTLLPDGVGQPLRLQAAIAYDGVPVDVGARVAPLPRLFNNEPWDIELRMHAGHAHAELNGTIGGPLHGRDISLVFGVQLPLASLFPDRLRFDADDRKGVRASGTLRDEDGALLIDDFVLAHGQSEIEARLRLELDNDRAQLGVNFTAAYLDLNPLQASDGEAEIEARLFSTAPLALDILKVMDLDLAGSIRQLRLGDTVFENIRTVARLENGHLKVPKLSGLLEKGTLTATIDLDAMAEPPRLRHTLTLDNISMTPLVSRAASREFRGGQVALEFELDSRGASIAAIAANADGRVYLHLSDVNIANRSLSNASGDLMLNAFALLNPLTRSNEQVEVECAVFNFPLRKGQADSLTAIGIQTRRLNILGGGQIDLASEQIDIGVDPKPREGIGLNLAGIVDFVRIGGTLREPVATTDGAGLATAGVKVSAALATGGLSLLAEGLLDRSEGDLDVCAIAAGSATLPGGTPGQSVLSKAVESTGSALGKAGNAVKGKLKRLFAD